MRRKPLDRTALMDDIRELIDNEKETGCVLSDTRLASRLATTKKVVGQVRRAAGIADFYTRREVMRQRLRLEVLQRERLV